MYCYMFQPSGQPQAIQLLEEYEKVKSNKLVSFVSIKLCKLVQIYTSTPCNNWIAWG